MWHVDFPLHEFKTEKIRVFFPRFFAMECHVSNLTLWANFFRHASGQKPLKSARCCKAWLIVVRRHPDIILPDASPQKFAIQTNIYSIDRFETFS